jgi:hypothetical protein
LGPVTRIGRAAVFWCYLVFKFAQGLAQSWRPLNGAPTFMTLLLGRARFVVGVQLAPLVSVGEAHLRRGLRMFKDHHDLDAFDALLAATVLEEGLDAILSADARLRSVTDLQVIVPGTDRFAELLG